MSIFRLHSFPIEQEPDMEAVELRLATGAANLPFPSRLLVFSKGFTLAQPLRENRSEQRAGAAGSGRDAHPQPDPGLPG